MKQIMPKYFVIKQKYDNPLWRKYILWLNNTYGSGWTGGENVNVYYGYDGNHGINNGTNWWHDIQSFVNNPIILTLDEWNNIINKNMKEDFSIEGSIALKNAFVEESNVNVVDVTTCRDYAYLAVYPGFKLLGGADAKRSKHFILPQDWNTALDYVKNYWEEEFKPGDWIFISKFSMGCCGLGKKDHAYEVVDQLCLATSGLFEKEKHIKVKNQKGQIWRINGIYRKATPAEIKEAQKPVEKIISVGGKFDVKINKDGIYHNSDNITEFVKGIVSFTNISRGGYHANIEEITFSKTGCQNTITKLTDWKKVYDEFFNFNINY